MYFDKLCNAIEKYEPQLIDQMQKAKLFLIEGRAHEFVPKTCTQEEIDGLFLPFPCTAVQDSASVVVLLDTVKKQKGFNESRWFIELVHSSTPKDEFGLKSAIYKPDYGPDNVVITFGEIKSLYVAEGDNSRYMSESVLLWAMGLQDGEQTFHKWYNDKDVPKEVWDTFTEHATVNANAAVQEILFLNSLKDHFILESKPRKTYKVKKGRILRSHQRSLFTIIKPKKIRSKLGLKTTGRALEEGYERRRHERTFRHERYTKMKGKTIIIQPTWVGPTEKTIGKRIYKVRLDL